jgi:hypothetical protein
MAKYCYRLQSCNPKRYGDINNLCLETILADINDTVYINGDTSQTYILKLLGVNTCICDQDVPPYSISGKKCLQELEVFNRELLNCKSGERTHVNLTGLPAVIGTTIKVDANKDCWEVVGEGLRNTNNWVVTNIYSGCNECQNISNKYYLLQDCKDPKRTIKAELIGSVILGLIIEVAEIKGCWLVKEDSETKDQTLTILQTYRACEDCGTIGGGDFYEVKNCDTGEIKEVDIVGGLVSVGSIITVNENTDCWEIMRQAQRGSEVFTFNHIYRDCADCLEATNSFYRVESCYGGEVNTVQILGGSVQVGDVITVCENNNGWKILAKVQGAVDTWTFTGFLKDCSECGEPAGDCKDDGERTIAYATMVRLPEPPIPDKGFKECCYTNLVLADENDANPYKNDFNGFYFNKQTNGDDCEFILHELATGDTFNLNNSTYGIFKDFGSISNNPKLTTFVVEWRKVLAVLGTGLYQVERNITVAGLSFSMMSNTFTLDIFSDERADKTVRLDAIMDGTMVHLGVNFKGSDFKTSLRTNGFFGRREPKYKQDNLVKRNYDTVQVSMSQENEYQMQTGLLPECITEEVYDFLIFGNELFASDYNLINHSYKFRVHAVEFDTNKGGKYYTTNRDARLNFTFMDRIKNKRKINC